MSKGFTTILDDMLTLDLDLTETMVYAIIFGFSQDGESAFTGSQAYLAKKCKCSRHKVTASLSKLVERGLVAKTDRTINGIKFCEYRVYPVGTGCTPQVQGGCTSGVHNNIENICIDNTLSIKAAPKFKKPSVEEVEAYCRERGNSVDAQAFVDFYESKGWKVGSTPMKDWHACVRTWESRDRHSSPNPSSRSTTKRSNFQVMRDMLERNRATMQGGQADEQ